MKNPRWPGGFSRSADVRAALLVARSACGTGFPCSELVVRRRLLPLLALDECLPAGRRPRRLADKAHQVVWQVGRAFLGLSRNAFGVASQGSTCRERIEPCPGRWEKQPAGGPALPDALAVSGVGYVGKALR